MNTRDAAKRVDLTGAPPSGRIWLAALLAALGTFILAWLLSPGLRSDLGQVADFLSELDAADMRDWILSFGSFSPVVYFLVVVAQVIISPIPTAPVTFAGAMIFGVARGLALSMAGSVVGSVLVFAAARRWGEALAIRLVGEETFYKYSGQSELTIGQRMVAARLGRIMSRRMSKLYLSPKASSGRLMGHSKRWPSLIEPSRQPVGLQGQYAMLFGPVAKCNKCA